MQQKSYTFTMTNKFVKLKIILSRTNEVNTNWQIMPKLQNSNTCALIHKYSHKIT